MLTLIIGLGIGAAAMRYYDKRHAAQTLYG